MKNIILDGVEYAPVHTPVIKEKNKIIECGTTFEVYPRDFGIMSWDYVMTTCKTLGEGWRLPTRLELMLMYQKRYIINGFADNHYWSSSEMNKLFAYSMYFFNGSQNISPKSHYYYIRPVRDVKTKSLT